MKRFLLIVAATLALLAGFSAPVARDAARADSGVIKPESVIVTELVFGQVNDPQPVSKLPPSAQPLAEGILAAHPKAAFQVEGVTLIVAVEGASGSVVPYSDCPNNTQFTVTTEGIDDATLKRITVAWTRLRHASPDAPLLALNVTEREDEKLNYDVQLKLEPRLSKR